MLSGLQSRFWPGYRETIQRVHDGAIGDIVAIQETWLRPPYVLYPRKPGLTEVEYQASNQYHFHWLSRRRRAADAGAQPRPRQLGDAGRRRR